MKLYSIRSIQSKLISYFTIAILIPTLVTAIIAIKFIHSQNLNRAETKVIADLNSAREIYRNKISQIEGVTRLTAARSFIIEAVIKQDQDSLQKDLHRILLNEKLDIFTVVDASGKVLARGRNPFNYGDDLSGDRFVQRVIKTKQNVAGTEIVKQPELMAETYELVEKATMNLQPTPMSKPRSRMVETSGMMLKAAVPIFNYRKELIGVLIGGVLLNRNFEIVTKVKEVVHEGEVYEGLEIGTATIFQNDYRISTNVLNDDGSYAISTLVSEEVNNTVLGEGKRWVGEAFVVNTWYISAYEPIRDIDNNVIGILYVGILKKPFDDILRNTILLYVGIAVGVLIIIIIVAIILTGKISSPLRKLEEAAKKITDGDYKAEFSIKTNAPKEIESLANSLNIMAKQLEKENLELESWADKLEQKVEERTEQLKQIHGQLFRSEKLASIGKLAAGVAHEINNPLTGVLTNASLLLEDLDDNDPKKEDVEVIVNETIRCREIVKRLLDFARQTKPLKKNTDINSLIENIILLVRNQTSFRQVTILKFFDEKIPPIFADTDQIQQVCINMILNAADAMPNGGTLSITTKFRENENSIEVIFQDTGNGIQSGDLDRIFDPFYTTKENGTGLGLSISYGIIERHGGTINVESKPGKGTVFTIKLPVSLVEESTGED
jgi:two-component system NtrC family sensor kinase